MTHLFQTADHYSASQTIRTNPDVDSLIARAIKSPGTIIKGTHRDEGWVVTLDQTMSGALLTLTFFGMLDGTEVDPIEMELEANRYIARVKGSFKCHASVTTVIQAYLYPKFGEVA